MSHTPQLFVPAVTPFKADLSVDTERLIRHAKTLLADGAHGLAPFGTTSEANSMSIAERMTALEALIASGIPADKLIPGTGCSALPDSIALTRHAVEQGCRGALVLPPFYYKGVTDDGVLDNFARIIDGVGDSRLKLYLYHIPQMAGVPITLTLIERLMTAYPGVVAGLKDSSGNWENTHAVIKAFPSIATYSASEAMLQKNVAAGGAGCISASANVQPANIVALIEALGTSREAEIAERVAAVRKIFESLPLIPAIKAAIAARNKDQGFSIVRPPFVALAADASPRIAEALALSGMETA